MTREEAISLLSQIKTALLNNSSWHENTHEPVNNAFDMAIEALQAHTKEYRTSEWNVIEIHNCYDVYQCAECERKITVFHRYGDSPSVADVTVDYPYCHCGAKMEVDE